MDWLACDRRRRCWYRHSLVTPPRSSPRPPPGVVFVAGTGRSGSTLLDVMLGSLDGLVSGGELKWYWARGLLQGRRCGCGVPSPECPFWTAVRAELPDRDPHEVNSLYGTVARTRHAMFAAAGRQHELGPLPAIVGELYDALRTVSGAQMVVDSSKSPAALLVALQASPLVHVIHLVRDPRAVAYSNVRPKRSDSVENALIRTLTPGHSTRKWAAWNALTERIAPSATSYHRIRYEDLVADPVSVLGPVLDRIGIESPLPVRTDHDGAAVASLETSHAIGGNPSKFDVGEIPLRLDDQWIDAARWTHQATATLWSLPLLHHYGYRAADANLRPRRSNHRT